MINVPARKNFSASSASKPCEDSLVKGLCAREEWAFCYLVDTWSDKIFARAYRILQSKDDAEEVVQEVMEKINGFQGESSLYTWIYRITINQSLMRVRKEKGKETVSMEDNPSVFEHGMRMQAGADWSNLPDSLFAEKECREFIARCVDELPLRLKVPYILKDIEGLSEVEVCQQLELGQSTMKNRVHRARLILRERLEERYAS